MATRISIIVRECRPGRCFSTGAPLLARRPRRVEQPQQSLPRQQQTATEDDSVYFSKDLLQANPMYDAFEWSYTPPEGGNHGTGVRVFNDPPPWAAYSDFVKSMRLDPTAESLQIPSTDQIEPEDTALTSREMVEQYDPGFHLPVSVERLNSLYRYSLVSKRVIHQTGKGRIASFYNLHVVGNGNGLLGYGEGKGDTMEVACRKALYQAVRQMDTVDRFESRTLWANLETKFGATKLFMRPRPVGFGLMCNPNVHQVCKAAGLKDISAKVWGSRNPMNVIKATCMLLQGGSAHLNMGDGVGGKGRRLDKGSGMRGTESMERERGRKILNHRTW